MKNNPKKAIKEFLSLLDQESKLTRSFYFFLDSTEPYLKSDGNSKHFCVFFLPYNKKQNMIYLGHHKKADDWIPPGGHIEEGELPLDSATREFYEELRVEKDKRDFHPFDISIKHIKSKTCKTHYDMWYLVDSEIIDFDYDKREYHDADWFNLEDGISKIAKNPEFVSVIKKLHNH